ncbi:MAG: polynucleotide adenylyltransferase [Elusimicrobia bacterium]|nr:polynucleotide adenylyltransferase [Elusimicrobiota bacterium]
MELRIPDQALARALAKVCRLVKDNEGRALVVGGSVRDALLGLPTKDLDVEVYGLEPARLFDLLKSLFEISLVGQAFGVIKVLSVNMDVSIPRKESKSGLGHKGFDVLSDPSLSVSEASSRRDFTVNSMALDPLTGETFDPHGGADDLRAGVLRHVSEKFREDPLRVLRGMQFAARFELAAAPETVELCRSIEPEGLAAERVFEEWRKLILRGARPSMGLKFLKDSGWIRHYPELEALVGCEQEPQWHPEGDVWTHTLHCMDAFAAERVGDDWEDLVVGFAVLCHDFGKPLTTRFEDGRIRSWEHEDAGTAPARSFLERLTNQEDLISAVTPLVGSHMRPDELFKASAGDAAVRRLARKVVRIDRLVRVARADRYGRPGLEGGTRPADRGTHHEDGSGFPAGDWLLEMARSLDVERARPVPIVMGRHLLELGLKPGPRFKRILDACYEAQIEGRFSDLDGGLEFLREYLRQDSGK